MVKVWDDGTEEYAEETEEYVEETEEYAEDENQFLASPVVQKIEKAKLYQMLLTSDFFDEDAADETIVKSVTMEIRKFVHYRLECLLGARNEETEFGTSEPPTPKMPWDESQIQALTALANRVLKSDPPSAPRSGVKKVSSPKKPKPQAPARKATRKPSRPAKKTKTAEEITKEHFEQYKSVDNPERKPMPSQMEIDSMNSQQAHNNAGNSFGTSTAGGLGGEVAQALIQRLT